MKRGANSVRQIVVGFMYGLSDTDARGPRIHGPQFAPNLIQQIRPVKRKIARSKSSMERIEEGDGKIIGAQPALFVMAVEEDNGGVAGMTAVIGVDHALHGIGQAPFVEGRLGRIPEVPGVE